MQDVVLELLDKNSDKQTEITTLINNLGICSGHIVKDSTLPYKVIIVHPLVVEYFKNDLDSLVILVLHEHLLESFRHFNVKEPLSSADLKIQSYFDKIDVMKAFLKLSDFIGSRIFRDRVSYLLSKSWLSVWWASKRVKLSYSYGIYKRFS